MNSRKVCSRASLTITMPSFAVSVTATAGGAGRASFTFPNSLNARFTPVNGINVVFLDSSTGNFLSFKSFSDSSSISSAWEGFATELEGSSILPNTYVLIAIQGGKAGYLSISKHIQRALRTIGAFPFYGQNAASLTSWACVGQRGVGAGIASESFVSQASGSTTLPANLNQMAAIGNPHVVEVSISSTTGTSGIATVSITLDHGKNLLAGTGPDGIYIAQIDSTRGIHRLSTFFTFAETARFARLLTSTFEADIIAITFKNLNLSILNSEVQDALLGIGSEVVQVDNPGYGNNWILIGSRAFQNSAMLEAAAPPFSSVKAQYHFITRDSPGDTTEKSYSMQGYGVRCSGAKDEQTVDIHVNSALLRSSKDIFHSFQIAAISPESRIVAGYRAFDLQNTTDQAGVVDFISQVPPGHMILIAYKLIQFGVGSNNEKLLNMLATLTPVAFDRSTSTELQRFCVLTTKGGGPGRSIHAAYGSKETFSVAARVLSTQYSATVYIDAYSGSATSAAYVTINMRTIQFAQDGLHIVVFNGLGDFIKTVTFERKPSTVYDIAHWLENLPDQMRIVIVSKTASDELSIPRLSSALAEFGVTQIPRGKGYALVGSKGRSYGCAGEIAASDSATDGVHLKAIWPSYETGTALKGNWVTVSTEPSERNRHVLVDGNEILGVPAGSGIQVVTLGHANPDVDSIVQASDLDEVRDAIRANSSEAKTIYAVYIPWNFNDRNVVAFLCHGLGSMWSEEMRTSQDGLLLVGIPSFGAGSALEMRLTASTSGVISFWTGLFTDVKTSYVVPNRRVRGVPLVVIIGGVIVVAAIVGKIGEIIWTENQVVDNQIAGPAPPLITSQTDSPPANPTFNTGVVRRGIFIAMDYCPSGGDNAAQCQLKGKAYAHMKPLLSFYLTNGLFKIENTRFLYDGTDAPSSHWPTKANIQACIDWIRLTPFNGPRPLEHVTANPWVLTTGPSTPVNAPVLNRGNGPPTPFQHSLATNGCAKFATESKDGDVAYFHIFSHGTISYIPVPSKSSYPTDYNDNYFLSNIRNAIANLSTRINFTFFFNCCHSGRWLGPNEQVPRGIAIAAARADNTIDIRYTAPTTFLKKIMARCIKEKVPFPTYEALRREIENSQKDANPAGSSIDILLQYNSSITNPNTLRWLDRIA
ncbi:hypothetical protein BJ165DRAFT_1533219 [Panaeolus papilionaceus]|nr:hypothetical protein BJ165DRAFT_1533219 [Panaeolus papilionaceus]